MIYNYTKCESVLAKIMADLNSSEMGQRTTDIKEWIFEAVEKIGAPMQYIQRESGVDGCPIFEIDGKECQVPIPEDLVHLEGVAYSHTPKGPWVRVLKGTGTFTNIKTPEPEESLIYDPANKVVDEIAHEHHGEHKHPDMIYKVPTTQAQEFADAIHGVTRFWADAANLVYLQKPEYFIKPGWIVLNKKRGFVKLAYKAIPTDEKGYPLIPDLASYQEAVYWYVMMKLSFPKYLKGKLGGKGVNNSAEIFHHIEQQWHHYKKQAYAEAMMPTQDDMKNIKNEWNRMLLDYNADDSFFKDINKEELIYNDYYHGY